MRGGNAVYGFTSRTGFTARTSTLSTESLSPRSSARSSTWRQSSPPSNSGARSSRPIATASSTCSRSSARWRPGAKGRAKLRAILEDYTGAPPTRSVFERVFLELIEKAGLPKPLVNAKLAGLEPDIYWPQWKLVVELDSRRFHSDPRTFESDRIREARLQRLGLRVLRITWKRLKHEPQAVIDDILALARLSAPLDALSGGALDSLGLARNR